MINYDTALSKDFFQISKRYGAPKIEENCMQNDVLWEVAAIE